MDAKISKITEKIAEWPLAKMKRCAFYTVKNQGKLNSLTTQEHIVIPQAVKADVTSAIIPVNVIKLIHEILQTLPIKY